MIIQPIFSMVVNAGLILSIIAWVMVSYTCMHCSMKEAVGQIEAEGGQEDSEQAAGPSNNEVSQRGDLQMYCHHTRYFGIGK